MITSYSGRQIDFDKKVSIYKNLHYNRYSIKQDGLVVAYCNEINLFDCEFKVSNSGNETVRQTKRKNVHAFVYGYICKCINHNHCDKRITYNPYKHKSFVLSGEEHTKIAHSKCARIRLDGVYVDGNFSEV